MTDKTQELLTAINEFINAAWVVADDALSGEESYGEPAVHVMEDDYKEFVEKIEKLDELVTGTYHGWLGRRVRMHLEDVLSEKVDAQ